MVGRGNGSPVSWQIGKVIINTPWGSRDARGHLCKDTLENILRTTARCGHLRVVRISDVALDKICWPWSMVVNGASTQ